MSKIKRESLLSLEDYSKARAEYRQEVMAHKRLRKIIIGDHVTLAFESELTMRYQIQEMLRAEKIFEESGVLDEIKAYNPMVPDGDNLKATMFIEYVDADERKQALSKLIGIEDQVFIAVDGEEKIFAIADEDIDRENEEKTSSVHFLRFQIPVRVREKITSGEEVTFGINHENYVHLSERLSSDSQQLLGSDFKP